MAVLGVAEDAADHERETELMPHPLPARFKTAAEAKLGRKLPAGYVTRICRENGGLVKALGGTWELYPIRDETDRKRLARTAVDLVVEQARVRDWPGFPPDAIAVGTDDGGNLLVLLSSADGTRFDDPVFAWWHEDGELEPAADGFEELQDG